MLPFAAPGIGKTTKGIRKSIAKRLANAPNKAARLLANDMGSHEHNCENRSNCACSGRLDRAVRVHGRSAMTRSARAKNPTQHNQ
jgi:hypothetical protein